MTVRCRSCDDPIMFVRIENTGKPMPVDPYPDPDGNVYARHTTTPGGLLGHVAHKDEELPDGWRIYMPHFATCTKRLIPPSAGAVTPPAPVDQLTIPGSIA